MSRRGKARAPFADDSDEDSIATDSTAESEQFEEYGVDRILLEGENEEGVPSYLIKWEGYPLARSTLEPRENIIDDGIVESWEEEKRRIKQGLATPFNEDEWQAAAEELNKAKHERRRRRKAKRRKRGIEVSSDSDEPANEGEDGDDDDENIFVGTENNRPRKHKKRAQQPEVKRKGVAQRLHAKRRTRRAVSTSSSNDVLSAAQSSSDDPLLDDITTKPRSIPKRRATRRSTRTRSVTEDSSSGNESEDKPAPRKQGRPKKQDSLVRPKSNRTAPVQRAAKLPSSTARPQRGERTTGDPSACDSCRAIHTKCDSVRPTCGHCARSNNICHYDRDPRHGARLAQENNQPPPAPTRQPRIQGQHREDASIMNFENSVSQKEGASRAAPLKPNNANNIIDKQGPPAKPTSARTALVQSAPETLPSAVSTQPAPQAAVPGKDALPYPSAATSSAPKAKRMQTSDKVFANWTAEKKGKPKPRVSGATPKDSAEPKFQYLSQQRRFQQYSKNERAPDPSALSMIDPKTGKMMPPINIGAEGNNTIAIHSAYNRRTPPPEKSPDPPAPEPEPDRATESAKLPSPAPAASPPAHTNSTQPERWQTCWHWTQGTCKFTDETCRRAHRYTGLEAADKQQTCYYWFTKGRCSKSDENCRYAHHDTGRCAPKPPDSLPPIDAERPPVGFSERLPDHQSNTPQQGGIAVRTERNSLDIPKKEITCYYWHTRGFCTKPDNICEFAHRDTGNYAGPPGSFRRSQTSSIPSTSANAIPVANRDDVPPRSARTPDVPLSERIDAGLKLQTAVQPTRSGSASPMNFTVSPMHMGGQSQREPAQQPPQWNVLGAAMQRRPSAPNVSMKATLNMSFWDENLIDDIDDIDVKLNIDDSAAFTRLSGSDPELRIERMITTSDFEHLMWEDGLCDAFCSTGGIYVDTAPATCIEVIADMCKANVSGLIATPNARNSKMLIYPANAEEWRFLDRQREHSSDCILRFRLFDNLPNWPAMEQIPQIEDVDKRPPALMLGEELMKLDSEMIFPKKELQKHPVRAVFLMLPPNHQAELEVLKEYFAALKCKVYHAGNPGAWDYFRTNYSSSCAVIVHPSVQLWRIPGLYAFLSPTGSGVRMFSIGVNPTVALLEDREAEFGCERLFPHGMVVFITDDAFLNEPEEVAEVINAFVKVHKGKPKGTTARRIAARPGIVEWLLHLAMTNDERGRRESRWMALYSAMCKLCRLEVDDQDLEDDPESANSPPLLISLSPELLPALEGLREGGDQEAATDLAVDWFAGWSLLHASRFRRFIVCHEPKFGVEDVMNRSKLERDPQGWSEKYQHIGVASSQTVLQIMKK